MLFFKLNTSHLSKFIQIKRRYNPYHSDAFCIRLFKAVPFSVIMISVTWPHKKQEPSRLKFGACFVCTVDNNPFTQKTYNQLINGLQFHQLTCTCGHSGSLSVHGYYMRSLKVPEGILRLRICRVICSCCGRTHALLPSVIVPYSQIPLQEQVAIISAYEISDSLESVMSRNPSIDESNCAYIIRQYYRHWKQRLLSERIDICDISLVSRCFTAFSDSSCRLKAPPTYFFAIPHNLT